MICATAIGDVPWVVDPGRPGSDLPPQGRSLFDHLTTHDGVQRVPFPFTELLAAIGSRTSVEGAYLDQPVKKVLIPLGRSLQRAAAAPVFFDSPRVVVAVDGEPSETDRYAGMLLRDRLFIGYLEAADVLEIISYNEAAGRFEFQVVQDYRAGGEPKVSYARRAVCTACHQNAAPIFARPLWDETNAGDAVAGHLQAVERDFYGIPKRVGVDVAYAIDNATDRANGFALTQLLWQGACGEGEEGAACRGELLVRTLQFALSGRRGFEQYSDSYRLALRDVMQRRRDRLWPHGLKIPDPDIPNRRPLAGFGLQTASLGVDPAEALRQRADIGAGVEPLLPRAAAMHWAPDADQLVARAVSGLAGFLAAADLQRIDRWLGAQPSSASTVHAKCTIQPVSAQPDAPLRLDCRGTDVVMSGLLYADGDRLQGRLSGVRIKGSELGSLAVSGTRQAEKIYLRPTSVHGGGAIRLADGDAVTQVMIVPRTEAKAQASLELSLRHDFRRVAVALRELASEQTGALAAEPFSRARVLPALFARLGMQEQAWCCVDDSGMPLPRVEGRAAPLDSPLLVPFVQICAACHRSTDPFPPNFLGGDTEQVLRRVAHCAERIQYRLAMWDLEVRQRSKSPMPPHAAAGLDDRDLDGWRNGPLVALRRALEDIAVAREQPLPSPQQVIARQYVDLRPCMPAS